MRIYMVFGSRRGVELQPSGPPVDGGQRRREATVPALKGVHHVRLATLRTAPWEGHGPPDIVICGEVGQVLPAWGPRYLDVARLPIFILESREVGGVTVPLLRRLDLPEAEEAGAYGLSLSS